MEKGIKEQENIDSEQSNTMKICQSFFGEEELLVKVIELFPYPIQVFSMDGTARLINKATLENFGIKKIESHVGKYNVFKDPFVLELGVADQIRQVSTGKIVYLTDFSASYQDMIRYFNAEDRDIQLISSDITCFPLTNSDGVIKHFTAVFFIKKVYKGKKEIGWGRQYIETHWQEPFNANETAKAACLSKAYFTKLFKKHIGVTPHEYYINYRVKKIKETLRDSNLSITQAFTACNMNYNGYYAKIFKDKVGVTPSVYRKMKE